MKKIALEEAYVVPNVAQWTPQVNALPEFALCRPFLEDFADERLRAMDEGEIEIAVLSPTTPGPQGFVDATLEKTLSREWNEYVANAIAPNSDRLKAFAALPMRDVDEAIEELFYAVNELGLVGALLNGYDNAGENTNTPIYYDLPQYVDFWKAAADLDVPIYLHPRVVPPGRETTYKPYPELMGAAWGFHVETAEHVLRIIMSGVFDKVPDLKLTIGHLGELLPYWAWRIDHRFAKEGRRQQMAEAGRPIEHDVSYYIKKLFITTSGMFETPGFRHVLEVMPLEQVMYSVDYPYETYVEANEWWKTLDGEFSQEVLQAVGYDNAAKLLKL